MYADLRPCPVCGKEYTGRADKRFCSNSCRATHHNRLHSDKTDAIKRVNRILSHNRKVLSRLNQSGTTRIERFDLVSNGFNFEFVTSTQRNKNGKEYRYCYEQGYLILNENQVLLVTLT